MCQMWSFNEEQQEGAGFNEDVLQSMQVSGLHHCADTVLLLRIIPATMNRTGSKHRSSAFTGSAHPPLNDDSIS